MYIGLTIDWYFYRCLLNGGKTSRDLGANIMTAGHNNHPNDSNEQPLLPGEVNPISAEEGYNDQAGQTA